ncbi:hypothetical protein Tco_0873639 [Tanacetum coccineum]|uniref:Uncharacterized protein n=1 Tax=Tanacetum coccineum TaxID=301880 RepID=A0ABQ5BK71_9ASTR
MLTQADFEGQAYEVVKTFYPDVIQLQFQMEECHKMLIERVNWANPEGDQGSCPALSISKMKDASYPDFGLELLVPEQMWIDDVCTYDISAKYGISHWWFTRQKFYIDRHDSPSHRKEVRTHMRILSVVIIKAYSRYGYDYLSEIILRRVDHQEHKIAEKDFKNLYPSDFEDLNLLLLQLIRQRVEDFQLGIESYQTQLNLTKPGWDATGYEFKHDYTIIESPRAVIFPVNDNERNIMRFNEIYKFSDGTLTRILETLDYRVKEFKIKRLNPEHPSDTKVLTMKMEILLEPTSNKLLVGSGIDKSFLKPLVRLAQQLFVSSTLTVGCLNSLVHSLRALSTLRRSGLRTASAAAKPCQGDSSKSYLITGSIYTE